jgi:hypothetical protein
MMGTLLALGYFLLFMKFLINVANRHLHDQDPGGIIPCLPLLDFADNLVHGTLFEDLFRFLRCS